MKLAIQTRIVTPDDALRDTIRVANLACQDTIDIGLRDKRYKPTGSELHRERIGEYHAYLSRVGRRVDRLPRL